MKNKWRKVLTRPVFNFKINLFIIVVLLIICSLLALYSAGYSKPFFKNVYLTQFAWFIIGLMIMIALIIIDFNRINHYSAYIYFITIFLLIITLIFGREIRNTKHWLTIAGISFQFSEFAKIATVLFLARHIDYHYREFHSLKDFVIPFSIVLFPVLLILLQPDLGSTLVFFPMLFIMLIMAEADLKYIISFTVIGLIAIVLPLTITYFELTTDVSHIYWIKFFTDKSILFAILLLILIIVIFFKIIYRFYPEYKFLNVFSTILLVIIIGFLFSYTIGHKLKDYQKKRLLIFVDSQIDPYHSGYNINQSKIAIGSGKMFGKGFLKGSQTQLGFIPEQTTDFIISVIGEEFGWLGMTIVLFLYYMLITTSLKILYNARDTYTSLVATGISTIFIFQLFINIGMTLGVMPVTGIPLPFISYGGSSLITSMAALGLLINIQSQK